MQQQVKWMQPSDAATHYNGHNGSGTGCQPGAVRTNFRIADKGKGRDTA